MSIREIHVDQWERLSEETKIELIDHKPEFLHRIGSIGMGYMTLSFLFEEYLQEHEKDFYNKYRLLIE